MAQLEETQHGALVHRAESEQCPFENEALTAMQMGHTVDILPRHYKDLVTREDAGLCSNESGGDKRCFPVKARYHLFLEKFRRRLHQSRPIVIQSRQVSVIG